MSAYLVDVLFGTGDDTFSLAGAGAQTLSGRVDGGGGANTFNQNPKWTLTDFTIANF